MELSELKAFTASVIAPILEEEEEQSVTIPEMKESENLPDIVVNDFEPVAVPEVGSVQTSGRMVNNLLWTVDTLSDSYPKDSCIVIERTLTCAFERISDNFGIIGKCFAFLRTSSVFESGFYDRCVKRYGLFRSTIANLISVYHEFCNLDGTISQIYREYSLSQLVEMLPLSYQDRLKITSDMTIKQIRSYKHKKAILSTSELKAPETLKIEKIAESKEVKQIEEVKSHEPEDTSGTVYIHFSDEIEFTRWYYENFNKVEMYPITISYNKN